MHCGECQIKHYIFAVNENQCNLKKTHKKCLYKMNEQLSSFPQYIHTMQYTMMNEMPKKNKSDFL